MKYLLPVRIDKKYISNDSSSLLLGTWALDSGDINNQNNIDIVDYHYDDFSLLEKDFEYSKKLYNKLIPILGNILNKHHNLQWEVKSWKIFLGSWLLEFIQVLLDRYLSIENALNNYTYDKVILTNFSTSIKNKIDFHANVSSDKYNHYLYGQIIYFLDKNLYDNALFVDYENNKSCIQRKSFTKQLIQNNIIQSILNVITYNSKCIVEYSYFSMKDFGKLFIKGFPNITPLIYIPQCQYNNSIGDISLRKKLTSTFEKEFQTENRFEDLIKAILVDHIPLCSIEEFKNILKLSNSVKIRNKKVFSTNSILSNEVLQCAVANQNTKELIMAQHGGSYGTVKWSTPEYHELDIADKYITFGWKNNTNKTIPLSHPKLLLNSNIIPIKNKILYIANNTPRYFYKNWSNPISGKSTQDYFTRIKFFFNSVDELLNNNILLRLYPNDYGWGLKSFLDNDNILYSKGQFYDELFSSELVICDHNQTTFLENLSLNKPTIMIWNTQYWQIRENVKEDFKLLEDAGIFYKNIDDLINFLNIQCIANISNWWNDNERQNIIKNFSDKYAKKNNNWTDDYLQLFLKEKAL